MSAILSAVDLLFLFVARAIAEERFQHDRAKLNLETMLRQVKGLQAEYSRVTGEGAEASARDSGEAASWKLQLQKASQENTALQATAEEARAAASSAEARLSAMVVQVKGMDKEYDRLLAENSQLQRQLAQYNPSAYRQGSKKDS